MDADEIEAEACYNQFMSHPPKDKTSFKMGFVTGAIWSRVEEYDPMAKLWAEKCGEVLGLELKLEEANCELAAKDAEIERLRGGLALCIGLNTNIPYPEVAQRHIDGYCERWAELERMK